MASLTGHEASLPHSPQLHASLADLSSHYFLLLEQETGHYLFWKGLSLKIGPCQEKQVFFLSPQSRAAHSDKRILWPHSSIPVFI